MFASYLETQSGNYITSHVIAGAEVAEKLRYRVRTETQLTCSVGIGPNTMLAKVATDINKPNGQYEIPKDPAALKHFVQSLSLRKVPGIGKVGFLLTCMLVCIQSPFAA